MLNTYFFKRIEAVFFAIILLLFQQCTPTGDEAGPTTNLQKETNMHIEWNWDGLIPSQCKSVCLISGGNNIGHFDVSRQDNDLILTFNLNDEDVYFNSLHLDIFKDIDTYKSSDKFVNNKPDITKFAYRWLLDSASHISKQSVKIPADFLSGLVADNNCFYIVAQGTLQDGNAVWAAACNEGYGGINYSGVRKFSSSGNSTFFEFCLDDCQDDVDFTYAWEDNIDGRQNDADYNDLVVQSDVVKQPDELSLTFILKARGARFDHSFKIKLPTQGIVGVAMDEQQAEVEMDSSETGYYSYTIFNSTKTALPEEYGGYAANTFASDVSCGPTAVRTIHIPIADGFNFDKNKPYEPYITVWPSGETGVGDSFDLNIWQVSADGDAWTGEDGKEYPNGILIPYNWKWPLERKNITEAYPDFNSIDEWNDDWASFVPDPSKVWSCADY